MNFHKMGLAACSLAVALAWTTPASAVVTFATFSAPTTAANFRFVNSGNATNRTNDATLYSTSTATGTAPGAAIVNFSFLQPQFADYVTNIKAAFTYSATVTKGTPAVSAYGALVQQGISGSFSFLTTAAITVTGPFFETHTYAAGSNLLSGSFSDAALFGSGSSAGASSSTSGGSVVTFTSDFLDFSNTVDRDRGFTLTSIAPILTMHTGANHALNSFRASAGGQFSADPAPLVNGLSPVPETASWAMMFVGFGGLGYALRRRPKQAVRLS